MSKLSKTNLWSSLSAYSSSSTQGVLVDWVLAPGCLALQAVTPPVGSFSTGTRIHRSWKVANIFGTRKNNFYLTLISQGVARCGLTPHWRIVCKGIKNTVKWANLKTDVHFWWCLFLHFYFKEILFWFNEIQISYWPVRANFFYRGKREMYFWIKSSWWNCISLIFKNKIL